MPDKIMLIEDDRTMLSLLNTLLTLEGFETVAVKDDRNLEVILDNIKLERPAVILLDVHLRTINGLDLLDEIRNDVDLNTTRVIMSSGAELGESCREMGANAFILKPYMPEDLIRLIRQVLAAY